MVSNPDEISAVPKVVTVGGAGAGSAEAAVGESANKNLSPET